MMRLGRAHTLRWEGHHLLLVLDRLLLKIGLVGRLVGYALIIRLTCSNEVRLLKLVRASANTTLGLMVRQVDRIVAPEVLSGFGSLDDFVYTSEQVVSKSPYAY